MLALSATMKKMQLALNIVNQENKKVVSVISVNFQRFSK